jgi:hypothetical protein
MTHGRAERKKVLDDYDALVLPGVGAALLISPTDKAR